jgi:uncharacterized protein
MVEIRFVRDSRGRLSSVFASGHADFATHNEDVVCAGVSAILQAAYAGLEEVARLKFEGRHVEGNLEIHIPEGARERADVNAIIATAEVALVQLAEQYPAFVRVKRETEAKR